MINRRSRSRNSHGFDPSIDRHGGMLGWRPAVEEPNVFFRIADQGCWNPWSVFFHYGSFHPYFGFYPGSTTANWSIFEPSVKLLNPWYPVSSNRTSKINLNGPHTTEADLKLQLQYACILLKIYISVALFRFFKCNVLQVRSRKQFLIAADNSVKVILTLFLIFFVFLKWWFTQLSWSDSVTRNFSL